MPAHYQPAAAAARFSAGGGAGTAGVGYMGRPPAGRSRRRRRARLSRNRMSAPQDCPIRTILLMTTFQGHVALHRWNVNKRRNGHSMTTWAIFRVRYFFRFLPPTSFCLFVTEEILCIIEHKRTMAHYCTHLCQRQTILHNIKAGIQSRELTNFSKKSGQTIVL